MGKLFVTLFTFLPAGRQVLLLSGQIGNSLYRDRFLAKEPAVISGSSFDNNVCNLFLINTLRNDLFLLDVLWLESFCIITLNFL
jgi:hypothetical protein